MAIVTVIVGRTDSIHSRKLRAELRCFFAVATALRGEMVLVRVEAYRVRDGAAVVVQVGEARLRGHLENGACELDYQVEVPADRPLSGGSVAVSARASVEEYGLEAESPALRVLLPRFSI